MFLTVGITMFAVLIFLDALPLPSLPQLIYLHHRRGAAGAEALDGEEGEFAVGGGLAYLYAQLAADVVNLTPTIYGVLFMKPSVELGL
jgi:hypothetical protein